MSDSPHRPDFFESDFLCDPADAIFSRAQVEALQKECNRLAIENETFEKYIRKQTQVS